MFESQLLVPATKMVEQLGNANDDAGFFAKHEVGDRHASNEIIWEMVNSAETLQFLQNSFDCGKGYEYINQQLRIALSNVD